MPNTVSMRDLGSDFAEISKSLDEALLYAQQQAETDPTRYDFAEASSRIRNDLARRIEL